MKKVIPILIVIALLVVGYLGISALRSRQQQTTLQNYDTVTASRGTLMATIGATGTVRSNQTAILVWQTSGKVEQINASLGDSVAAGLVLASLEQASLSQSVILTQSDLINAQNALDDLLNSDLPTATALQNLYKAQRAVIEAERAMDRFDEQKYKDSLDKARDAVIDKNDDLKQAQDDFEPYEDWAEDNQTRRERKQDLDDAQNAYDEAVRVVDLLELEQNLAQANLGAAQAALASAQREYDRLQDGPDPDDIAVLEARIDATQATLDMAHIETPFAGTITSISNKNGDRVSPGTTAFRLDDLSRLLVDVRISEVDINRISVGQNVKLTFDAILDKEYSGVVSEVSGVGQVTQGIVEFAVTVELTNPDENVRPGMTAAVNIIAEQTDNALLVPNRAVRVVDGERVVYILNNGSLALVAVTLGSSSGTESEVIGGSLRAGDLIVLNPPQVFDTMGPPPFVRR